MWYSRSFFNLGAGGLPEQASMGMSVYQFAGNNPVSLNDPLGNKMTARLLDRGNGYYDFQGDHSFQSADPLSGSFMDAGNGGGKWLCFWRWSRRLLFFLECHFRYF
jgi:hypothetical protein